MRPRTLEQITAQELAGLQIDTFSKLRNGSMTFEQWKFFNGLTFEQREALLGKQPEQQKVESSLLKLRIAGIIIPALTKTIDPNKAFGNKTFGGKTKVNYYLWDTFKKYLLDGTKSFDSLPEAIVDLSTLQENAYDNQLMPMIGVNGTDGLLSKEEILYRILHLTEQQPNGEEGRLLTNGYATIIGYFMCDDGTIRVASVDWSSDDRKWYCSVLGVGYGHWNAGGVVLSCNSISKS